MQLDRFRVAKQSEIAKLRCLAEQGKLPEPVPGKKHEQFCRAIGTPSGMSGARVAVIAEYKRASPSRGTIREDLDVGEVALQYAQAGASALSILTEEHHFHGNLDYLWQAHAAFAANACPPLLRKDFIFDPLQVQATAATPAAALLLIVRLTPDAHLLRLLREQAEQAGMSAVVEVFDEEDLHLARESGARIVQVNARDLQSFAVDREACLQLARRCPPNSGEIWIAASGIDRAVHLTQAADAGFSAVLVGTALMEQGNPGNNLAALLNHADKSV